LCSEADGVVQIFLKFDMVFFSVRRNSKILLLKKEGGGEPIAPFA
jgi:hypothetical protein